MMRWFMLFCAIFFLLFSPLSADSLLSAPICRVIDGDTVVVLHDKQKMNIRLYGIDTPEKRQQYGPEATAALKKMLSGKTVFIERMGKDRYGRIIGIIYTGSNKATSINENRVKSDVIHGNR